MNCSGSEGISLRSFGDFFSDLFFFVFLFLISYKKTWGISWGIRLLFCKYYQLEYNVSSMKNKQKSQYSCGFEMNNRMNTDF